MRFSVQRRSFKTSSTLRVFLPAYNVPSSKECQSPEAIQEDFPLLKRAQIYGAIAFYLDHEAEVDKYLEDTRREFKSCGVTMATTNPALWEKIQRARAQVGDPRI